MRRSNRNSTSPSTGASSPPPSSFFTFSMPDQLLTTSTSTPSNTASTATPAITEDLQLSSTGQDASPSAPRSNTAPASAIQLTPAQQQWFQQFVQMQQQQLSRGENVQNVMQNMALLMAPFMVNQQESTESSEHHDQDVLSSLSAADAMPAPEVQQEADTAKGKRKRGRPSTKDVKKPDTEKPIKQMPTLNLPVMPPMPFFPAMFGNDQSSELHDVESSNEPNESKEPAKKKARGSGRPRGRPRTRPRPGETLRPTKLAPLAPANYPMLYNYTLNAMEPKEEDVKIGQEEGEV